MAALLDESGAYLAERFDVWKVSDDDTRNLMVDYYKRLLQGEGRAAALRRTQRALMASAKFSHPYYWASFIPIGNWNPLPAK